MGRPHSTKLARISERHNFRQVLECGSPGRFYCMNRAILFRFLLLLIGPWSLATPGAARTNIQPMNALDTVSIVAAVEEAEFDEEGDLENLPTEFLNECCGCGGCAASRQKIVDEQNATAGFESIDVDSNRSRAVFQIIFFSCV